MLPCVCSVIDHRWRQNVITKKWHTRRSRVCHWCSYILTSSLIYYWTDARQYGIYSFYIIKSLFYFKIFQNNAKAGFSPAFAHFGEDKKEAIWRNLLSIQSEAISLVTVRSKDLWLVELNHATVKPDSSVATREMKTELRKSWRKRWKNQVSFCHQSSPVSKSLDVALKIAGDEKIPSENLWLRSPERPSDSSFEWKEPK